MNGSSSKRSSKNSCQIKAESQSQRSSKRRKQNSDEGSSKSKKEEAAVEDKENAMIMINTSKQKVDVKNSFNDGSKRGNESS